MYIEEIILEGFKSYAQRTRITGFDRSFNAITGENGAGSTNFFFLFSVLSDFHFVGKSNILDAICFVLGITSLSQVNISNILANDLNA